MIVRLSCNKPRVSTKRVTVSLINVISRAALIRMLLLCISSYIKSVLRYQFLILDAYHEGTLHFREPVCEDL
jgi:hypothetical protein